LSVTMAGNCAQRSVNRGKKMRIECLEFGLKL